jgi:catechol 2,3-dioxygenase-like lactoylglutathione lyase family enzyme
VPQEAGLDAVDHVALVVESIADALAWYTQRFRCRVAYRDDTWALLEFANLRLALMTERRHPPHVGLVRADAEAFGALRPHRDGTRSVYLTDPAGNSVEVLAPAGAAGTGQPPR